MFPYLLYPVLQIEACWKDDLFLAQVGKNFHTFHYGRKGRVNHFKEYDAKCIDIYFLCVGIAKAR